jgi:uncharacterized protein with PIN domain
MSEPIIARCADCRAVLVLTPERAVRIEVEQAMGEEVVLCCDPCWRSRWLAAWLDDPTIETW